MAYTLLNLNGGVRTFEKVTDYTRALEAQKRVEHLVELNGDRVSEEMRGEWDYRPLVHQIQQKMHGDALIEDSKEH